MQVDDYLVKSLVQSRFCCQILICPDDNGDLQLDEPLQIKALPLGDQLPGIAASLS